MLSKQNIQTYVLRLFAIGCWSSKSTSITHAYNITDMDTTQM